MKLDLRIPHFLVLFSKPKKYWIVAACESSSRFFVEPFTLGETKSSESVPYAA